MKALSKSPRHELGWGLFDEPFENLFEGFFRPMRMSEDGKHTPAVDVSENDSDYLVLADLPGVKKEHLKVELDDDLLTISAETKGESEQKEGDVVLRHERHYGKYMRSMRLAGVDREKVKASFKDGVLKLTLPKVKDTKATKTTVPVN